MITIEAPRVAGRQRAREDVSHLDLGPGSVVVVRFPERSAATPSYLDELILAVCLEGGARLTLKSLSERAKTESSTT